MSKAFEEFLARFLPYGCVVSLLAVAHWYAYQRYGVSYFWLLAVCAGMFCLYWKKERKQSLAMVVLSMFLLGAVYQVVSMYEVRHTFGDVPFGRQVEFDGVIIQAPDLRYDKQFLTVQPYGVDYNVRVRVDKMSMYSVGDKVRVSGLLKKPEPFKGKSGVVFDYGRYLAVDIVVAEMGRAQVTSLNSFDRAYIVPRFLYNFRRLLERVAYVHLSSHATGLALGTTLGTRQYISDEMADAYRSAGISHIVVLSGFNVTIIAIALRMVLGRSLLGRRRTTLITIVFVWLFVGVVGFSASIVRAAVMLTTVLIAGMFDRESSGIRSLLYATTIMVLLNPRILLDDIGFELSVLATVGLFVVAPYIESLFVKSSNNFVNGVREILVATLSATIMTLPVLCLKIGSIAGWGLVSNIAVVWLVPSIMLGVFLVIITAWLPVIPSVIGWLTGLIVYMVDGTAIYIARISPHTIQANAVLLLASTIVLYWLFVIVYSGQALKE